MLWAQPGIPLTSEGLELQQEIRVGFLEVVVLELLLKIPWELLRLDLGINRKQNKKEHVKPRRMKPWTWAPMWGTAHHIVPRTFREGGRLSMIE